ncbi:hypothetical protein P171DRAFT_440983 [Karstenula rhodostoma CBS 690.94]|uniref:Uncharacterized protein n=1 Tax=Karstenula rhodostoma CBS 690.94 TaxID=1392251 RepID=A0A9P4PR05_9PLEO|nr:hypothetical protein P171DRAFT_440983 [Karstenula rhodostoma CBS 690.94]
MTAQPASDSHTQTFPVRTPLLKTSYCPTDSTGPEQMVYGAPFEKFRPVGGGADGDLFRRFNVRAAEEADFLTYWAVTRASTGIFTRDATGILAFRISSADLNNELDIGTPGTPRRFARWIHVYDAEGTSWLTQFRQVDIEALPKIFDSAGKPVQHDGRLGLNGPSGQTVRNFVARQRIEAELARIKRY